MSSIRTEKSHDVELRGVTKRFDDFVAVDALDLRVDPGEFLVLVGPSGCGKSTLLRLVVGLEDVSDGTVLIDGRDVTTLPPRRREVAMVFQNYALYPHMTVRRNLEHPLRLAGVSRRARADRVTEVARMLGLDDLLERRPSALSGGQRQRVAMGRAVVREPRVLLMDEPLSNLDAKLRVSMRAELRRRHERFRATTLYVTHDQVEAMTLGDRVAVMRGGRIEQIGTPDELYRRPANTFVASFVGSPAMNLLVAERDNGSIALGRYLLELGPVVAHGREFIVGIRPESFKLAASAPEEWPRLQVRVLMVEQIGAASHVAFEVATRSASPDAEAGSEAALVTAIVELDPRPSAGDVLELAVDPTGVHLFDLETGEALAAAIPIGA